MANMNFTIEDLDYVKNTLRNYYHLKEQEMIYRRMAFEKQLEIDQEKEGSGINYSGTSGNGCSVSYPENSYVNQLILEQSGYDRKADDYKRLYLRLDKDNRIEERCNALPVGQHSIIYAVFRKKMSYLDVSSELFDGRLSKQAINERVDSAMLAFMERQDN